MPRSRLAALSQPTLVVFGLAFLVLVRQAVRQRTAIESGAVWTLVATFLAFRAGGGGLDSSLYLATGGLIPDLTIYLDITPEEGLRRRAKGSLSGEEFNRLDAMASEFHQRVYEGYREIGIRAGERWKVVNAAQPPDAVFRDIMAKIDAHLELK